MADSLFAGILISLIGLVMIIAGAFFIVTSTFGKQVSGENPILKIVFSIIMIVVGWKLFDVFTDMAVRAWIIK